jgi:DNA-binding NtrC family response regulator
MPDEASGLAFIRKQAQTVRIVIVDLKSSGMGGGGFLQQVRYFSPHAAVLISGPLGPFLYHQGSFYDFTGPSLKQEINDILLSINQRMQSGCDSSDSGGKQPPPVRERFGPIIGRSESINTIYRLIENLNHSSSTVLIQGESGTGKELIARSLHRTGSRKDRPFVAINCGAIPANLMESELFGHERGAFTTAIQCRMGKFEAAQGGTLFLDEVGELDRSLQVKLLRVLQEKEFQRIGGNKTFKTDVQIISATAQNLKQAVEAGYFRDDLYYRLNVIPVHVPPLRERNEDIPLLLNHFFETLSETLNVPQPLISEAAQQALENYNYPGNVRELANIVERLLITSVHGKVALADLPREMRKPTASKSCATQLLNTIPKGGIPLEAVEKELIFKTLDMTSGNKAAAARMLGITRRRLYLRLAQYETVENATLGYNISEDCHMM